ncbi:MAPEG family protein [Rhodovulum sp. FJ3]|uniref:MAPEG family protein n=1 Tax=Rhodovulum sp. FJ3 TaxID=3079053 RepID=UPI00293DC381|nr:MAPEG family protein [Rhodovulum sp. FJ3]MDV4169643.1 MAPEG family protein [Rhodovulum sp. FJ3]
MIVAGLFHLLLLIGHGTQIALSHGICWGTGRRTVAPVLSDLDRRFDRTVTNNTESMIAFVPVSVAALTLGAETALALVAAKGFIAARIAFAGLYLLNIPYVRTLVWFIGNLCIAAIAYETVAVVGW